MLPKHLKPFHINNEYLTRVGPKLDGGYILDKRIIDITEKIITCGLNDDWEFEKHFLKINPSCEVMAYDHTVNKKFWIISTKGVSTCRNSYCICNSCHLDAPSRI